MSLLSFKRPKLVLSSLLSSKKNLNLGGREISHLLQASFLHPPTLLVRSFIFCLFSTLLLTSPFLGSNQLIQTFFVEYKEKTHLIEGSFSSLDLLRKKLENLLHISSECELELLEETSKSYMVIHEISSIPNKSRLRVTESSSGLTFFLFFFFFLFLLFLPLIFPQSHLHLVDQRRTRKANQMEQ